MSQFAQLTRTAYLSGISPMKWKELVVGLINKLDPPPSRDFVAPIICDAVLSLLSSFPGDHVLREYLRCAIAESSLVHQSHLLSAYLRSVRATQHDASTLEMIGQLVLSAHYESRLPPLGSLVPYSQPPAQLLDTVSDTLYLLRLSYEFAASPFHRLTTLASELLMLTLSCVGDISEVSTAQATVLLSDLHDVLQIVAPQDNVRQALDSFLLSLSMVLGDGAKQAEEAEMLASIQLSPGKQETIGFNPSFDLLTGNLIMKRLVSRRATRNGSGCEQFAVANLIAWYRASVPSLAPFYAHVILSAVTCLTQEASDTVDPTRGFIWKSFILGRVPFLLQKFREKIQAEGATDPEVFSGVAMQSAVAEVLTHGSLLDQCETSMRTSVPPGPDSMDEDSKGPTFRYELLASLVSLGLIDHAFANELLPSLPQEFSTKLSLEAQEFGADVDAFIESRLSLEMTLDDTIVFLDRISNDYRSHAVVAEALRKRFVYACDTADMENLSRLCNILGKHDPTLDIISLHISVYDMIARALACLEDYDLTTVGDPQTAVSQLGEVVLFLQSIFARFKISSPNFAVEDRTLRPDSLRSSFVVFPRESLSEDDKGTLNAWIKAIFDSRSEGIDDEILRSTKPLTLLRLSATLFSEAIAACTAKRIDIDALKNGVSYYLGPLLNWTLVGVVQALLEEVERSSFQSIQHLTVLDAILMDKNCPAAIIRITRHQIIRLNSDPKAHSQASSNFPNMASLVDRVLKAPAPSSSTSEQPGSWATHPRDMIRHALASADAGRAPSFDIERCLAMSGVHAFFDFLWRELLAAAAMGKIEICRRFATFVLASTSASGMESCSDIPPLLPIFLHVYVPSLLRFIDKQIPSEQSLSLQLLCAIVVSALTFTINLDRALMKHTDNGILRDIKAHNLPSSAMARKLRIDLRKAKSPSGLALFQRLSVSSSFVSMFPVFVSG